MSAEAYSQIYALMGRYFEGLYLADADILSNVFHENASYVNASEEEYLSLNMAEYFEVIRNRVSPAKLGELREEGIIAIEVDKAGMAFVKAHMQMMGRKYLDFLTCIKTDSGWKIHSKVFTFDTLEA